ncbi:MAG: DUF1850 domain-containing protein [Phyllobacteriaceae bacterium]|nr:DUF1850 domain-containing protein [Phyllobacteriaceae bacterium]
MSICIASAGSVLTFLAGSFSLTWIHSVEKTEWVEHWQVEGDRLALVSARVKGPGAGIDLPPDAVWEEGGWTYRPALPPLSQINLAASGTTPSGWQFCTEDKCMELGATAGAATSIWAAHTCTESQPAQGQ